MGRTSFTQWEDMRRIWSRLIWKIWISSSSLPNWGWLEFRRGETIQIWELRQQREWWCSLGPDMLHKTLPQRKSPKIELTENQWLHPKSRHARRPFCHQDLMIATPGTAHNNGRRYQLLVNSWTAMSVFLVQWSMLQTAPGSPFWIVLAQKLQFHYVSLALKPWYNWKNATKITKTGNYVEPNSMFPFSASTAATFIYSVCG